MIRSGVSNDIILEHQPTLSSYYHANETTWNDQISQAMRIVIQELKKRGKNIRLYCTPLTLQETVTKTTNFTSDESSEDEINRMIWVVVVTAITGTNTFKILTSSESGGTFVSCKDYTENGTETDTSLAFTAVGVKSKMITDVDKYYKVDLTVGTTVTFESFLVESSFHLLHLYKAMQLIYESMILHREDDFDYLAQMYKNKYEEELQTMSMTYDEDEDGVVDYPEEDSQTFETRVRR